MIWAVIAVAAAALVGVVWMLAALRKRHADIWLPAYVRRDWAGARERRKAPRSGRLHVMFCIADHFEPAVGRPGLATERHRVDEWLRRYPDLCAQFRDADGRPPRHTFFYPAEDYRPEHLERLSELAAAGLGEVEVHLHHDNDTSDGLRRKLLTFKDQLRRHGHLGSDAQDGSVRFGFVHGNWALDNSRRDGRWCGVNDELRVLAECGCYADFTLPSAPSDTQTRRINSIYYSTDDPARPRSHDDGEEVRVGGQPTGDLMIVQGPLLPVWTGGRLGVLPRIENSNLAARAPLSARRVRSVVNARVCVAGRPDWVFVKVYAHGCDESNWPFLLGPGAERLHSLLGECCNDGSRCSLHYVTARELFNIVKAAEQGLGGDPGQYRDLAVAPPPVVRLSRTTDRQTQEAAR
jgi:hypothetical protein